MSINNLTPLVAVTPEITGPVQRVQAGKIQRRRVDGIITGKQADALATVDGKIEILLRGNRRLSG